MKSKFLINVQHWTTRQFADLMRFSDRVRGIILGDPFCPLRMFEHGNWDIPVFAKSAKEAGLCVALQTPVYLTQRNFNDMFSLIRFLERRELLDLLFVQDVGLLSELKESDFRVPTCWSFWGGGRGDTLSRDLLNFLTQLNLQYLETNKPSRVGPLQECGLKVIYRLYAPQVATFGRFCYTQYITGSPCNGGDLCKHEQPGLVSTDGKLNLKVSGYTLEHAKPSLNPSPKASPDYVTVYVGELVHLSKVLGDDSR